MKMFEVFEVVFGNSIICLSLEVSAFYYFFPCIPMISVALDFLIGFIKAGIPAPWEVGGNAKTGKTWQTFKQNLCKNLSKIYFIRVTICIGFIRFLYNIFSSYQILPLPNFSVVFRCCFPNLA